MTMPKTNSINRDLGTDYWMDEKDMKKEQAAKQVKQRKAAAPDQFPKERIRDEIVSPYKNNWILFIAITIFSLAFFVYLFPEELQVRGTGRAGLAWAWFSPVVVRGSHRLAAAPTYAHTSPTTDPLHPNPGLRDGPGHPRGPRVNLPTCLYCGAARRGPRPALRDLLLTLVS